MITRKIKQVSDNVCKGCYQLWKNECRAYSIPHSDEERKYRNTNLQLKCLNIKIILDSEINGENYNY